MLSNTQKQGIAIAAIKVLYKRFSNFPEDASNNRNAPFHEAFLGAFVDKMPENLDIPIFVSLSSWLHGLNTSLGQTFFESVAHILIGGEKKKFENLRISSYQQTIVTQIITDLQNGIFSPNLIEENNKITNDGSLRDVSTDDFTADIYVENNESITCFESKTVRPNSGTSKSEKEKLLKAKAALKNLYPNKDVKFFIVFPFTPFQDRSKEYFMNNNINFNKFYDAGEVLLDSEFWDYLTGQQNTMDEILLIINAIATPSFIEKIEFLNNNNSFNSQEERYATILREWFLCDELKIMDNINELLGIEDRTLRRTLQKSIFSLTNGECKYNNRYEVVRDFLP